MNYLAIDQSSTSNGTGFRVVLWVAGCSHHCPGCHNPESWNPVNGKEFNEETEELILNMVDKPYISGITFSGGDPMHVKNRKTITALAKEIKEKFPDKTLWCYTGYLLDDLKDEEIIDYLDVLVEGRFVKELFSPEKHWVGSSNQNVIYLKK